MGKWQTTSNKERLKAKNEGRGNAPQQAGQNLYSQLWVAKKNFHVGGKQYCYFV